MKFEIEPDTDVNFDNFTYNHLTELATLENNITYSYFFQKYLQPNIPCIIKDVTNNWESNLYWINNNAPNLNYLEDRYGSITITVYKCSERYFNLQKTIESTFTDYIRYWKNYKENPEKQEIDYLKDWHLKNLNPCDNFYEVPIYFASDWLNEYFTECTNDDYRFVYMGPNNTWTPFHADVFTSYSWSANVCGKKRWLLFPPGEENHLRDNLNNLPYDVLKSNLQNRRFLEVIQNPGEAIFVPTGWHHQVWNLDDTISINHNWVNGCNIKNMFFSMQNTFKSVVKEIEHCESMDGFPEQCQLILNSTFGLNFKSFYEFLRFIAVRRMDMLKGNKSRKLFHGHTLGAHHAKFDLKAVQAVLDLFINTCECDNLEYFNNTTDTKPDDLFQHMVQILDPI